MNIRVIRVCSAFAFLVFSACATMKPPSLQVERLGKDRIGAMSSTLNVVFGIRNPNPEPVAVDKVEYELVLNGQSLGRGYISDPVVIPGFGRTQVVSKFDLNYLRLPGAIKAILDSDRVRARARGHFYMQQGEGRGLKKLGFNSEASVDIRN